MSPAPVTAAMLDDRQPEQMQSDVGKARRKGEEHQLMN